MFDTSIVNAVYSDEPNLERALAALKDAEIGAKPEPQGRSPWRER